MSKVIKHHFMYLVKYLFFFGEDKENCSDIFKFHLY